MRAWLRRQASATDKVLVKLDFANAFNTVSRQAVLDAAVAHFPGLARWVAWCYGKASSLQFGSSTTLQSAGGVQQGDPLGPLLFAAALQPLASSLRAGQLDLSFFFLDDGVIAGDVAAVQQALQEVERRGAAIGLRLNLAKCEVVGVGRLDASTLSNRLPPELLRTPDGASRLQWNFELLGAAVGDVTFSAVNTLEGVDKAAPLEALGELEDAQVALRLLRSCAGHCRMVHTARCCPSRGVMPALEKFDSLVKELVSTWTLVSGSKRLEGCRTLVLASAPWLWTPRQHIWPQLGGAWTYAGPLTPSTRPRASRLSRRSLKRPRLSTAAVRPPLQRTWPWA